MDSRDCRQRLSSKFSIVWSEISRTKSWSGQCWSNTLRREADRQLKKKSNSYSTRISGRRLRRRSYSSERMKLNITSFWDSKKMKSSCKNLRTKRRSNSKKPSTSHQRSSAKRKPQVSENIKWRCRHRFLLSSVKCQNLVRRLKSCNRSRLCLRLLVSEPNRSLCQPWNPD